MPENQLASCTLNIDAVQGKCVEGSTLVSDVLQIWVRAVFASIRRRAGIPASNRRARCGAVTMSGNSHAARFLAQWPDTPLDDFVGVIEVLSSAPVVGAGSYTKSAGGVTNPLRNFKT